MSGYKRWLRFLTNPTKTDIKRIRFLWNYTGGKGLNTEIRHLCVETFLRLVHPAIRILLQRCMLLFPSDIIIVDLPEKDYSNQDVRTLSFYLEEFDDTAHKEIYNELKTLLVKTDDCAPQFNLKKVAGRLCLHIDCKA